MRVLRFALILAYPLCLAISCQEQGSITISGPDIVEFSSDACKKEVIINAAGEWMVEVSDPWLTVTPTSGVASSLPITLNICCQGNTSNEERTGTITITSAGVEKSILVKQLVEQDPYRLIAKRIVEQSLYNPSDSLLKIAFGMMNEEGAYSDVDYDSRDRTAWAPNAHYYRLLDLANAYLNPHNAGYLDASLFAKIEKGLQYWDKRQPVSDNWWYGKIEEPQNIGMVLLYIITSPQRLSPLLESSIIKKWEAEGGNPQDFYGANRASVALHWFYLSCLTEDRGRMESALDYLFDPVKYTNDEGFQKDGSFFQHGNQLYIGAYSESTLEGVLQVATCLRGTDYGLGCEKLQILRNYLLNTYAHCIRGQVMNYDCMGRAMSYKDFMKNPQKRLSYYSRMAQIDEANADKYSVIMDRISGAMPASYGIEPVHQHYYRADYTLHVRPKYNFSVRLCSTRTCKNENGDGDNIFTYYLSDGNTIITRDGEEYNNLMPVLNWSQMPGVTIPIRNDIPLAPAYRFYGTSNFSGGVSDLFYGCTAYKYYDTFENVNTGAAKGWFFFDDEVVCLGTDIHSDYQATTTVNQCRARGDYYRDNNIVWHDSIGYYFPVQSNYSCSIENRNGNWHTIAPSQVDEELEDDVFSLVINHDDNKLRSPQGDHYAYIVVPGVSFSEIKEYSNNTKVEILSNNESLQAVRHSGLKITEAIFYKPGVVKLVNGILSVDRGCCMLVNESGGSIIVNVSDPAWTFLPLTIELKRNNAAAEKYVVDFSKLGANEGGKTISISM